jgi:acetyltransferase-like isoleucine patch superfamily enzyme
VLHPCTLFNLYRRGLRGLTLGHHCFIGEECLLDLAEGISLADHVTLAERVTILTHTNVGYRSHPLQATLPARTAPVTIGSGSFVGTNVTILPGVAIGECAIIGACSLVRDDVPSGVKVAGVPARIID